jgi:ATP/maltotriose-dependent transcriptional regulator MalT/DNA-binding SARP family transcriptional activator
MGGIQQKSESEFAFSSDLTKSGIKPFRYATLPLPERRAQRQRVMAKTPQGKPSTNSLPEASKEPAGAPPTFFLRTKLLPPRPAPELLSRPRLAERLITNLENPLTLVTANAGSGKTTFVADFLRTHKKQFVWYQLDHTDTDPSVFLGYLTFGIQQAVPGFGNAMFAYLQEASAELAQNPERAVDVLINEVLELVDQKLIVVLDDYHHLGAETPVHAVLDRLLAYLPDVLHIVIVSREMPPLALARMRTQSPTAIIERSDLLFTDEETRHLFRQVFDLELTPQQLAEYRERTHGWITALQLVRQVAQKTTTSVDGHTGPADLIEVLRQSERDIFDYFAEEVFADESEQVKSLLLKIALLDRIELDTCGALFKGMNCARILPNLVKRNVFLTVASDGQGEEYRLHPLFQSFLRRRLRSDIGRSGVSAEHQSYADYFLGRGLWEQGVRHLLAAEDFVRAGEVVAEKGGEWISSGALSSLVSMADSLPTSVIETHPRVLAHRAEVARLRGEYESAQVMFRRAAALLQQCNDAAGEADTLHSLATLARREGDYALAFTYLDRALELVDDRSAVRMKCANTRGLALVALGEWTASELEFRSALQLAQDSNDGRYMRLISHNLGLPAMMRGDFGEALRWLRRMLRDGNQAPLPQEATAHLNMAHCYLYLGDLSACEKSLDEAIERCQLFNLIAARADAFETYGNLFRERGEIEKANEYYQRAARAYDEAGVNLARTELWEEQALLNMLVGDLGAARSQIDRLIAARPLEKNEIGFYTASLAKARIMIAQGEETAASEILSEALQYFHNHTLYYYEAQASIEMAFCCLKMGNEPQMLEQLRRTIDLAVRYDYEYWLQRQAVAHAELFATEEAAELLPSDLRSHLATLAPAASMPVAIPQDVALKAEPVNDLTINMLGPIQIFREFGRPLAADAWTTRRARDILCFIASRRHRRASKDTIIDTFWGETDFEVVEKNFHPTVSHIRKALNSNQPLKQNFIIYRDGDYQLNPELSYRIDIEEFDRLVTQGENARRARQFDECVQAYEAAAALYRGDFAQGSYEPWVDEQRTYYKEQYLRILEALAGVAQKQEEWNRSLQLAQSILHEDPYREDIHCLIMRAHVNLGNRGAAKEQYENLKRILERELGIEPGPETRKIFQELFKKA